MENMLSCFIDSETLDDDSALPDTDGSTDHDAAPVSSAARIRQMLSIHSLVRQASFVDDSPMVASDAVSKRKPTTEALQDVCANSQSAERCTDSIVLDRDIGYRFSVDNGPSWQDMDQALSSGLIWQDPFQEEQSCFDFSIESDEQHWRDAWALFNADQVTDNPSLWNLQTS